MRRLSGKDKRRLFAACVARTLKGQLAFEAGARPEVEATVARLDLDFAAKVRANPKPVWTASLLWSRLRKDRLLAIARTTLGGGAREVQEDGDRRRDGGRVRRPRRGLGRGDGGGAARRRWPGRRPGLRPSTPAARGNGDDAPVGAEAPTSDSDAPAADGATAEAQGDDARSHADAPASEAGDAGGNGAGPADAPPRDAVRVTIAGGGGEVRVEPDRTMQPPPVSGNGHDAGGDPLEIPAFLRRTP